MDVSAIAYFVVWTVGWLAIIAASFYVLLKGYIFICAMIAQVINQKIIQLKRKLSSIEKQIAAFDNVLKKRE